MSEDPATPGTASSFVGQLGDAADLFRAEHISAGLQADQFEPFFQPIVNLSDRGIVGFEVLARWRHPEKGLLFPSSFVPLAEACGLIREIDLAMLEQAWRACDAMLADRPPSSTPVLLSVNLSTDHLLDRAIVGRVRDLLSDGRCNGGVQLQFEITETLLINNHDDADKTLGLLRDLGVSIALDDFGTGYSSLVYLLRLPIDCIKIDRSFSEHILHSSRSRVIVASVIDMANALGIRTVAEGVEEGPVADALAGLGCNLGQGILFGAPAPKTEVRRLLDRPSANPRAWTE